MLRAGDPALSNAEACLGSYEFLEHTADIGIVATGSDLREAFASVAEGLFAWVADLELVRERETREVAVASRDLEALVVDWLNELNYIVEVQRFLFRRVQVVELEGARIRAVGYGEPLEPGRHHIRCQVKAATYHMLQVSRSDETWRIQVILDI
ncbi:MAG: archease [Chloroflexi bacterium]|nr:archease [Chloroflexota bacterium]